jgi:hypothetical protein
MNLTEKEEQEMIERAKAGDAKANYDMSLWALDQAAAEPDEDRWNRLAAKCLIKAAEGGYEPAKEQMNQLLTALHNEQAAAPQAQPQDASQADTQSAPQADDAQETAEAEADAPEGDENFDWSQEPDARPVQERQPQEQPNAALRAVAVAGIAARAIGSGAKTVYGKGKELITKLSEKATADTNFDEGDDEGDSLSPEYAEDAPGAYDGPENGPEASETPGAQKTAGKKLSLPDFSQWDDKKWKKMQTICIIVCVVLVLLIFIMVRSGKNSDEAEDTTQVPPAATTVPATPVPTEEPVTYPDADLRAEIEEADLDIYPDDDDYVEEETIATVTPGAGLNLRKGPGSSYSQIVLMGYNSEIEIYAYKNGWALVRYQDTTWGWCSEDYIKVQ